VLAVSREWLDIVFNDKWELNIIYCNKLEKVENKEKKRPLQIIPAVSLPPHLRNYADFSVIYDNCLFRGVAASIMGAGLGICFGALFGAGLATPESLEKPMWTQVTEGFKQTGKASLSSAKSFAIIGGIFSTTECTIEHFRAKSDIYNGFLAGCITGGSLSYKSGPQGMAIGCAGFAAFSGAIDYFFSRHGDDSTKVEHDDKFSK